MTSADLEFVLNWRNHPVVRTQMFNQRVITKEQHQNWFEKASINKDHFLLLAVGDVPFGFVQFKRSDGDGIFDWGFYIDPEAPKGSGMKLGRAALTYAFGSLSAHKVRGQALLSNYPSCALHKKLGFVHEGILWEQKRINGIYCSLCCFGLIEARWWQSELR
jgi:UDP-4-amino-4,6-dideoxy-N-acetyl-beta-L-altrosamine N-acetyltransferase